MLCNHCGTPLEENAAVCSSCGEAVENTLPQPQELATPAAEEPVVEKTVVEEPVVEEPAQEQPAAPAIPAQPVKQAKPYQPRRKPHILLRLLMQLLSLAVCLVLCVSLVATVVLTDLNHIMSAGGIKQLVTTIITPAAAPHRTMPSIGILGVYANAQEVPEDTTVPEETQPATEGGFTIPGDLDIGDIPDDLLNGGNSEENISSLVDWFYEEVLESSSEELNITKEQLQTFVEESTVSEYMADKLAGFAEDFINGTENTVITTEEILNLLDENIALIEETFNMEMDLLDKQMLTSSVEQMLENTDINTVIREQVFASVEESINESAAATGITWEQLQPMLQILCADSTMFTAIGVCAFLMLLLCLLNFYNVPAGLTWSAFPCILMGAVLTVPLKLLPTLSQMFGDEIPAVVMQVLNAFVSVLLPIHSAVLYIGLALLVFSIVWRIIRASIRRKRRLAAAAA